MDNSLRRGRKKSPGQLREAAQKFNSSIKAELGRKSHVFFGKGESDTKSLAISVKRERGGRENLRRVSVVGPSRAWQSRGVPDY